MNGIDPKRVARIDGIINDNPVHEPAGASRRIDVDIDNDTIVVIVVDQSLLDENNIIQIREEIESLIRQHTTGVFILDLSNVIHMSSMFLGTLITVYNKLNRDNDRFAIIARGQGVYDILAATALNRIFKIYPTVEEARSAIKAKRRSNL